jgi:hypothetical protein
VREGRRYVAAAMVMLVLLPGAALAQDGSPEPAASPDASPGASPSPSAASPTPLLLERSASVEQDGVRVRITLERNPMPAREPTWVRTVVRNVGDDDLIWRHDGCRISVGVGGALQGVEWRPGLPAGDRDPTGLKWRASEWWGGGSPTIRITFEPEGHVGQGDVGCADVGIRERIPPGGVIRQRARWDGSATFRLGPPPSAPVRLTGRFSGYTRPSLRGGTRGSIEVALDAWILAGRDEDMLHPMEIVDAALADPRFRAFIEPIRIGAASDHVIWYDETLDVWEVGVFLYRSDRFRVGLVDPRTGEVLGITDRPWREGEEPYP